jgi:hypothetical protein
MTKEITGLTQLEAGMQFQLTRMEGMKPETFVLTRLPNLEEKIDGEFIRNERMNKWWATPIDGGQPELMCFDREFEPSKYEFKMP